ncbi:hypothetical protein VMCG_04395 [Cytospora schulzeri]|uniref:Uncharacterized protein n=1 Tax=Cytospora schulzeri TaxID=448051 RepID=A0A423WSR8_9PEZI|nr:hypothetical protein VMCG_04395 [Valsa malicola]
MSGFEIELPSSPDPLGDESVVIPPSSAAPPSTAKTRRVLQSAVSSRFSALPGTSPRKRMFALDVGDEITHQTIYVTVEAGPDGLPITRTGPGGSSVNRRLFGSPTPQTSPRRGVKTTTTTIPLRGLTDDEADAMSVPRRRRRSSGRPDTPTTAGPKKKKKGTPTPKASTRKPRRTPTPSSDALQSEMPAVLDQPTPRRRGRPPKRKVDDAPPEQDDPNASQTAPRKRGRTARRQSLDADALDLLAADNYHDNDDAEPRSHKSPTPQSLDVLQNPISNPTVGDGGVEDLDEDEEEDPFLAIPSDPLSEHDGRPRQGDQSMEFSDSAAAQQYGQGPRVLEGDQGSPPPEMDDYAPMMDYDDRSDGGSQHSEHMPSPARGQHLYNEELGDQGHLPGESDDYAPMVDRDDKSDIESQHSEATPRAEGQAEHQSSQLEDQGPLPDGSDDYAPVDHDDESDLESRHSEDNPGAAEHRSSELGDQGALPGESDEHAPMMDHEDREDKESRHSESTPRAARHVEHQSSELEDQGPLPGDLDDYAPMVDHDDRSDTESHHSGHTAQSGEHPDNTVDPETFTMIGIETMPSFQGKRDVPTSDLPEIGENTSLFINKTLDSLRQEFVASEADDGEVDLLGSREQTPAEVETERPAVATAVPQHQDQPSNPPANRSFRSIAWSPATLEQEGPSAATSSPWNRPQSSQSPSIHLAYNRSQSLRRSKASLAHVASERSQYRLDTSTRTVRHREANDSRLSPDELNAVSDADSFSDIPEEVLAAAVSQEELQPFEGQIKDEHGWAVDVGQEVAAEKGYSHMVESAGFQNNDHYETTTSTPNRPNHDQADDETISQRSVSRSAQSMGRSSQGTQHSSPPHSIRSRLGPKRLLTPPDETTSSSNHGTPAGDHIQNAGVTSATPDDIGSSPPEITTFHQVDERQMSFSRRDSDTPANPPPSIHLQPVHERITYAAGFTTQTYGHRPGLSPIVRAGSRLQNILSDPPSPSGRSSVLGSPFKGSVKDSSPLEIPQAEDAAQNDASPKSTSQNPPVQPAPQPTQSAAESPTKSWAMSLAPLGRIKNMVSHFTSPKVDVAQAPEDPFGPSSPIRERPGSAFMDRIKQASREGSAHSSRASVARATAGDNDERSSAGDPTPRAPERNTSSEKTQNTGMFGSGLFRGRLQHVGPSKSLDGAMDEEPRAMFVDRRSEQTQTNELEQRPADSERHTRQPRTEDAEQLPGDAQSQLLEEDGQWSDQGAMQVDDAPADDEQSEEEDIWAIEADRTASSPTAQERANESINPFRKSGLSIDWGTRSTITQPARSSVLKKSAGSARQDQLEDLDNYSLIGLNSGDSNQPSAKKPSPEAQTQPKRADLSDFFSSSPNFIERERRKQALLAESAAQEAASNQLTHIASPQMTGDTQNTTSSSQRQPSSSSSRASPDLPSPGAEARQRAAQAAPSHASSSLTPERPRRPQHRPAPPPSQNDNDNDAALFETWSVSSSRAPSERPHVTGPLSDARPSSPDAIERPSTPVERADAAFGRAPLLKALPAGRAASPSKSCLRSPLKPKTPGRVVEFTSSTLSPNAEAQARAAYVSGASTVLAPAASLPDGQRLSGRNDNESSSAALDAYARPNQPHHHQQQQQQQQHYEHDQDEPVDPPLSQTRWSRKHWLLLDEFLQSYRRDPRGFRAEYCSEVVMLSPEKRRSRTLLGKLVTTSSQGGEEMVLEQWHLDVADAFRDEVGGWPEVVLVKRLFALIVGEERRRLGLVPTRR